MERSAFQIQSPKLFYNSIISNWIEKTEQTKCLGMEIDSNKYNMKLYYVSQKSSPKNSVFTYQNKEKTCVVCLAEVCQFGIFLQICKSTLFYKLVRIRIDAENPLKPNLNFEINPV